MIFGLDSSCLIDLDPEETRSQPNLVDLVRRAPQSVYVSRASSEERAQGPQGERFEERVTRIRRWFKERHGVEPALPEVSSWSVLSFRLPVRVLGSEGVAQLTALREILFPNGQRNQNHRCDVVLLYSFLQQDDECVFVTRDANFIRKKAELEAAVNGWNQRLEVVSPNMLGKWLPRKR